MFMLGMPTLIECSDIESCAALCQRLGLQFIELNMNLPQYQADTIDAAHFRAVAQKHGISYTIHLDENLNVCDFNGRVAQAWRQTALDTIALAKTLDIPVLNMHLSRGVHFTLPEQKVFLFAQYKAQYLSTLCAFRDDCECAIGEANIRICVENCAGYLPFQLEALQTLLESPVFALTLDTGHNHAAGQADEPFIFAHAERLRHLHLHDALGKRDHLALGTGEVDIARYLTLAQKNSLSVVLETKTVAGLEASVRYLRQMQS